MVIFFHNLRGYDGHILIRYGLSEIAQKLDIDVTSRFIIGKSSEKLSAFQFGPFIFRDSYLHLGCSLKVAVNNLIKSNYHFPISEKFGLPKILREKGVYPYSWIDSIKKFEQNCLPPIEAFYDDLKNRECSKEDYEHAQKVWRELSCKNFGEYHHYYLMADVVLLAEVFEEYRNKELEKWGLDPAHFVTVPSYTYKIFLKELEEPIQVLWDLSMFDFFRDSLRGGYCSVGEVTYANVYGKNNECIAGLDMNSLYPTSMRFSMPHSEFTWISGEEGERILYDSYYN
jgi:hypothetical protein